MLKKNLIKIIIPLIAIFALATTAPVLPALAAPHNQTMQTVQGTVTGVTGIVGINSFTIEKADKTSYSVSVNQTTKYYLISMGPVRNYVNNQIKQEQKENNGQKSRLGVIKELHIPFNWRDNLGWLDTFNKAASLSDISVGDRVITRIDPNSNIASQVLIVKAPVIRQIKGTINIITSPQIINVTPAGASTVQLSWDANTEFIIKGVTSVPAGISGTVTYNSDTKVAILVNLAGKLTANP
jgi:hypothetical protein